VTGVFAQLQTGQRVYAVFIGGNGFGFSAFGIFTGKAANDVITVSVLHGNSIAIFIHSVQDYQNIITVLIGNESQAEVQFGVVNVIIGIVVVAIIASIVVPPQVLIIPLFYEMLAFNMIDTYWGLILPQVVAPAMVFILKRFFDAIPIELEDAARVDGASRFRIFWSIVLPLSRPILASVAIFVFIGAWNNFLWPFLVINDTTLMTLPVGLQTVISAYGVQYAQVMAQAVLAALPLIIVFIIFQKQIVKGVATSGFGGQ
jgi:ABC-type glycerol-3-phosphate transport system permease component